LMDRQIAMSWITDPHTMLEKARERAMDLWEHAENKCPLDGSQRSEIARILSAADRELSNSR